jgi:hypothetical protein
MTRIPSVPYRVKVTKRRVNGHAQPDEQHSFATLAGAIDYRDRALKRPNTYRVETSLVIDETTPQVEQKEPERQIRSMTGKDIANG